MKTDKSVDWQREAEAFARIAYEDHFPERRGVYQHDSLDVVIVFNNNPYANYPTLRDWETEQFRKRLTAAGIKELSYATYPPPGEESAGYTYAMFVDTNIYRADWVADQIKEITREAFQRMQDGTA